MDRGAKRPQVNKFEQVHSGHMDTHPPVSRQTRLKTLTFRKFVRRGDKIHLAGSMYSTHYVSFQRITWWRGEWYERLHVDFCDSLYKGKSSVPY